MISVIKYTLFTCIFIFQIGMENVIYISIFFKKNIKKAGIYKAHLIYIPALINYI